VIVYYSLRDPSANWEWPAVEKPLPAGVLALSWTLNLEPLPGNRTRLYIRLRALPPGDNLSGPGLTVGGLFDWATIALLYQGLNERVHP
jgi:hypothetical protein